MIHNDINVIVDSSVNNFNIGSTGDISESTRQYIDKQVNFIIHIVIKLFHNSDKLNIHDNIFTVALDIQFIGKYEDIHGKFFIFDKSANSKCE